MGAVAIDPIAELLAAGEGRFEWEAGRLLQTAFPSPEHGRESPFVAAIMEAHAQEHDAGRVFPDGLAMRLEKDVVRIADVAFFREASLGTIAPTHREDGADPVVEIVSPESRNRDRGQKSFEYERAGVEERWIVDLQCQRAGFHRLRDGADEPALPDAEGKLPSSALPGFFVRVERLWNRPKLEEALRELGVL